MCRLLTTFYSLRRICNYEVIPPKARPEEEITLLRTRVEELENLVIDRTSISKKGQSTSPPQPEPPDSHDTRPANVASSLFFLDERYFAHLNYRVESRSIPVCTTFFSFTSLCCLVTSDASSILPEWLSHEFC